MASQIDCLVIGHNQMSFVEYVADLRRMGERSGAFRDVNLSFYEDGDEIVSCRDHFNKHCLRPGEPELSYDNIFSATVSYLCSFLHRAGLSYDYVNSYQEARDALIRTLREKQVRTVAITTTYYVVPLPITDIVQTIRCYSPETKIIIGGPYVQTQYKIHEQDSFLYLLQQIGADQYVVSSQGEQALIAVVEAERAGRSCEGINNVVYRDGAGYRLNPITDESNDLKDNPVDFRLFADDLGAARRKMVMVRTVNSCPFACAFCSFPAHAGPYRYLEPGDICRELDQLEELGVTSVTFIDDTFNVPISRFRAILEVLRKRKYSFRWNCNFRSQHSDEEAIALMKECGCEGVFLGIESGSDTILRNMNKKSRVANYRQGVSWLKKHGIMTYASFIVGFPGETEETIAETVDFIETAQPDFFRAQLWYYDTMTPIHRQAAAYGLRNSQFEWAHDTMTAPEAADWIDHMHSNIRNSVWLPQNDFDYPSLFNLLSRSWTVGEIKAFLRDFNEKVSAKLARGPGLAPEFSSSLLADAAFNF